MPDAPMNYSMIDLRALSEPVTKLIEAVSSGVGILHEPRRIRERAKAEADAKVILAISEAKAREVLALGEVQAADIAARAATRIELRELRRQANLEAIVTGAIRELPAAVDETPVDPDWVQHFVDQAADVGDAEMQSMWSRILAGEVAHPGRYSPRTLAFVRLLRKEDARLFSALCSFVWNVNAGPAGPPGIGSEIFLPEGTKGLMSEFGIQFGHLLHLVAEGFLLEAEGKTILDTSTGVSLNYFGRSIRIAPRAREHRFLRDRQHPLSVLALSRTGTELSRISGAKAHEPYFDLCIKRWREEGYEVSRA